MSLERMADLVREQAQACADLGSPLYGALLSRLADDVLAGGPAAVVLAGHEDDPGPSALALRLMGPAHALALSGHAPALAAHYPSCGGDGDADAAWPALRSLLAERLGDLRAGLASAPQTNEVGRAAPLLGGLLRVLADAPGGPLPVRLWEIGASAGLNLRADRFTYRASDGSVWGQDDGAVVLAPAWDRVPAGAPRGLDVVERVGGDVAPVDVATAEGSLRLTSYVWPDQLERLARLRAALEVARATPARVVRAGAAELLADLELAPGAVTVVWHSVMWQYLDAGEQDAVRHRLRELGDGADDGSRLVHLAFEPGRATDGTWRFAVTATTWPGGRQQVLGEAPPHGVPVTWA